MRAPVQAAIDRLVASGAGVSMQVAVVKHGEVAVHARGRLAILTKGVAMSNTLF